MNTFSKAAMGIVCFLSVAGCGFKPIYATPDGANASTTQLVSVASIAAPDLVLPLVTQSLNDRIVLKEGANPQYDLFVEVRERAERLAVQIDATVTRYNYRLIGIYTIVDRNTGKRLRGRAQAVTSYNIVTSQYSTLFAENTAREKAAQLLAEEIERDVLIQLSDIDASDDGSVKPRIIEDEPFMPGIVNEDELLRDFDDVPDPTPFENSEEGRRGDN